MAHVLYRISNGYFASQNSMEIDINSSVEVDQLTTFVQSSSGIRTENLSFDLSHDMSGHGREDSNEDFVDGLNVCSQAKVAVSSFIKTNDDYRNYAKPIQLFLKTVNGNTKTIKKLTIRSTVEDLQREASCLTETPVGQFRLMYEGKNLIDPRDLLSDCGIRNESTVFMTMRLRGGSKSGLMLYRVKNINIINMLGCIINTGLGIVNHLYNSVFFSGKVNNEVTHY